MRRVDPEQAALYDRYAAECVHDIFAYHHKPEKMCIRDRAQVSGIDGTHMDEIAPFTMATAVMSRIRQLFQPEKEKR